MAARRASRTCLEEVRVRDLALLEGVDVTLAPGLNVLSGETGEGKSLLLTAIQLLLGARARKGLVRSGCDEAIIEGRFRIAPGHLVGVTDLVDETADEVCLRRVVTTEGQSRAYLDGGLCPVGMLGRIGEHLVDVHGQRHSLLRAADQRAVLDRFGETEAGGTETAAARWAELWGALTEVRERRARLEEDEAGRLERLDYLRFQIRELDEAAPQVGEESELETRVRRLEAGSELDSVLGDAASTLSDRDEALGETCARLARRLLDTGAADSGDLAAIAERLQSLGIEAEDLGRECGSQRDLVDRDPAALDRAEMRLNLLRHLARRHRTEPDALADRLQALKAEAAEHGGEGDPSDELRVRERSLLRDLTEAGRTLWEARRVASRKLERALRPALKELRMERARLRVRVAPDEWPARFDVDGASADGPGPVSFLVAANPGEPEQPLEQVASGGETARILLALKGALAGAHRIPLLIFDEIDAGVGGRVGVAFGRRIAHIARHHQVLVVTHLPQVAAFAERHLLVRKEVKRGRTRTQVVVLEDTAREAELAAMLGGAGDGAAADRAAREQARALIQEAAS
ncbi:MAG: DNA repair protein RecN [Planctomycetes bacterium]|nr:DNA repair protein RecN [Planctomycetota bacterium]